MEAHVDISAYDCQDDWTIGYEMVNGDWIFRLVKELNHDLSFHYLLVTKR